MKKIILQNTVTAAAFLAVMGISSAHAHTITGSLGTAATAVDTFQTKCSKNTAGTTAKFISRIKGAKGVPLVSVQAVKGKLSSKIVDTKSGDAVYSKDGIITGGGEGVYTLLIGKNKAGKINYTVESHCESKTGAHTGQSEPVQTKNQ